jgi:hypothetical protein
MKVMKGALGRLWRLTRATSIVVGLAVMAIHPEPLEQLLRGWGKENQHEV